MSQIIENLTSFCKNINNELSEIIKNIYNPDYEYKWYQNIIKIIKNKRW